MIWVLECCPPPSASSPHSSIKCLISKFWFEAKASSRRLRPCLVVLLMFHCPLSWCLFMAPVGLICLILLFWCGGNKPKKQVIQSTGEGCLLFFWDYLFEYVHLKTRTWLTNSSVKKQDITKKKSKVRETSPGNRNGVCGDACWYSGGFKSPLSQNMWAEVHLRCWAGDLEQRLTF